MGTLGQGKGGLIGGISWGEWFRSIPLCSGPTNPPSEHNALVCYCSWVVNLCSVDNDKNFVYCLRPVTWMPQIFL
jgi:hypothetical protein